MLFGGICGVLRLGEVAVSDEQTGAIQRIDALLSDPWSHDIGHFVNACEELREIIEILNNQLNASQLIANP